MVGTPDSGDLGKYMALGQVGMEMVAPIVVGWLLDYYLDWSPWAVIGGTILGLVGGLWHLIVMANRLDENNQPPPGQNEPQ